MSLPNFIQRINKRSRKQRFRKNSSGSKNQIIEYAEEIGVNDEGINLITCLVKWFPTYSTKDVAGLDEFVEFYEIDKYFSKWDE